MWRWWERGVTVNFTAVLARKVFSQCHLLAVVHRKTLFQAKVRNASSINAISLWCINKSHTHIHFDTQAHICIYYAYTYIIILSSLKAARWGKNASGTDQRCENQFERKATRSIQGIQAGAGEGWFWREVQWGLGELGYVRQKIVDVMDLEIHGKSENPFKSGHQKALEQTLVSPTSRC